MSKPVELREFISETLKQIIDGVTEAQRYASDINALVNPRGIEYTNTDRETLIYYRDSSQRERHIRQGQNIIFDVAVTVMEGTEQQAGVGVFISGLTIGGKVRDEITSSSQNRIKFSVPVFLPEQENK